MRRYWKISSNWAHSRWSPLTIFSPAMFIATEKRSNMWRRSCCIACCAGVAPCRNFCTFASTRKRVIDAISAHSFLLVSILIKTSIPLFSHPNRPAGKRLNRFVCSSEFALFFHSHQFEFRPQSGGDKWIYSDQWVSVRVCGTINASQLIVGLFIDKKSLPGLNPERCISSWIKQEAKLNNCQLLLG